MKLEETNQKRFCNCHKNYRGRIIMEKQRKILNYQLKTWKEKKKERRIWNYVS